jgi:hypothetical protein
MKAMDLDSLRGRWNDRQQQIDAQLQLDAQVLRSALARRTQLAFRRHSRWLLLGTLGSGLVLLALTLFLWAHRADSVYRFLATPLVMLALGEFAVSLRQWLALERLDFSAAVSSVQATLETLRGRRLRMTRCIMLSSVLLWLPLILVVIKGLSGFDLLDVLHPSVLFVNLLVGLLFIPLALGIARLTARRYANSPGYQRFLDDSAGYTWRRARSELETQQRFEGELASDGATKVMTQRADHVELVKRIRQPLGELSRRLNLAIALYAALMVGTGAFNAVNGGHPQFLVPALLLHLLWITHLVLAIVQRHHLARWQAESESVDALRELVSSIVRRREYFARWTLIAAPMLLLATAQVLTRTIFGTDLLAVVPRADSGLLLAAAAIASLWLHRRCNQPEATGSPAAMDWISIGTRSRCQTLIARLQALQQP